MAGSLLQHTPVSHACALRAPVRLLPLCVPPPPPPPPLLLSLACAAAALLVTAAATTAEFFRVSPLAGRLMLPYLAFVAYANALNYNIWKTNPEVRAVFLLVWSACGLVLCVLAGRVCVHAPAPRMCAAPVRLLPPPTPLPRAVLQEASGSDIKPKEA